MDPESDLAAALDNWAGSKVSPMPPRMIAHRRSKFGDPDSLTAARVEPWVHDTLLSHRRPAPIDDRVKRILKTLPQRLADNEAVSLRALAKSVGLSPSRLMHLFTASVGVPLRPCILGLRLGMADEKDGGIDPVDAHSTRCQRLRKRRFLPTRRGDVGRRDPEACAAADRSATIDA